MIPPTQPTEVPNSTPFDERKLEEESTARRWELDLKEREVAAKEREVATREEDLRRSRWLNPTVIGLFAAAVGLIGSVVVARVNNQNSQQVERLRSQSNLILEAIKTGSPSAACTNLLLFVRMRLLADPDRAIQSECASAPKGAPSLPADNQRKLVSGDVSGTVFDLATGPVANAKVTFCGRVIMTDSHGKFTFPNMPPGACLLQAEKAGFSSLNRIFECCEAHVVDAGTLLLHKEEK